MDERFPLSVTELILVHPLNTPVPIEVTVSGTVTEVTAPLSAKTPEAIVVIPEGMLTVPPGPVYPLNVTPSSSITNPFSSVVLASFPIPEITQMERTMENATNIHPNFVPNFIFTSPNLSLD